MLAGHPRAFELIADHRLSFRTSEPRDDDRRAFARRKRQSSEGVMADTPVAFARIVECDTERRERAPFERGDGVKHLTLLDRGVAQDGVGADDSWTDRDDRDVDYLAVTQRG